MAKSKVAVVKGPKGPSQEDIDQLVQRTFDLLGGVENMIKPGMRVVLKPNVGHIAVPEESVCTSPEVVRAVIRAVKKANPSQIIIAEAGAMGVKTMEAMEVGGMCRVAEEEQVEILDLKGEGIELFNYTVPNPLCDIKRIQLPKLLFEDDVYLINIPIMKAHTGAIFTNALKNLKGCVQDHHHFIMHCTYLIGAMYDLGEALKPDLNIVDMIRPLEGFGPHSGFPVEYDVIIGSTDIAATDVVTCEVASIDTKPLEFFAPAKTKPLGEYDLNNIEIVGDPIEKVRRNMYIPYLKGWDNWPDYDIRLHNACSSCQGTLSYTMARLVATGLYKYFKDYHILVGRWGELPEDLGPDDKLFFMGDCTKPLVDKLRAQGYENILHCDGCPPSEPYPTWTLVDKKDYGEHPNPRARNDTELIAFNLWMEGERRKLEEEGQLKDSIQVYSTTK